MGNRETPPYSEKKIFRIFWNIQKYTYFCPTINKPYMETNRTIPIGKMRQDMSIKNFLQLGKKICYDESIQRRQVWTKRNGVEYRECLLLGKDVSNIVMADVQGCMTLAQTTKSTYDHQYFSELHNQGVRYVSIDGGNRTRYLMKLHDEVNWNDVPDDVWDFFNIPISVVIINNATKLDLHDIASYLNSGESWNKQEKRNACHGIISDFIRKWGNTYSETTKLIKGVTFPRMKDLELMSHFLLYHQSKGSTITNTNLNNLFKSSVIYNEKQFLDTLKTWSTCIQLIHQTGSDITKSFSFNLFMYLLDMDRSYNSVLKKDTIQDFVNKYLKLENHRIDSTYYNPSDSNWANINRNIVQFHIVKFNTIYNDMIPFVSDFFYTLDSVRTFTEKDKIAKCIETGGVINRLDGTTEVITPLQSTNGKKVHGNHKNKPHSKGGSTTFDNMDLMFAEDNLKLSNNY